MAIVVMVTASVDVHVLAAVVRVGAAAEAGRPGVAEAEGVGGEVELGVGVGERGGGYAHGISFGGLGFDVVRAFFLVRIEPSFGLWVDSLVWCEGESCSAFFSFCFSFLIWRDEG